MKGHAGGERLWPLESPVFFEKEAGLPEYDFVAIPKGYAFAGALRNGDNGAVPQDRGAVGAAVVEETVHGPLGVKLEMGVSPGDGWIGSGPIVTEGDVVLASEPLIGVNNLAEPAKVDAPLLEAKLLLLGGAGGYGNADFHDLVGRLESGGGPVMRIEAAGRYIGRQLGHQFHLHLEVGREFDPLIFEAKADVAREGVGLNEDELVRTSKSGVGQQDAHG